MAETHSGLVFLTDVLGRPVSRREYKFRKKSEDFEFNDYLRLYFAEFCREIARLDANIEHMKWGGNPLQTPLQLNLEFRDYKSKADRYQIDSELLEKASSLRRTIRENEELEAEAKKGELLRELDKRRRQRIDSGWLKRRTLNGLTM